MRSATRRNARRGTMALVLVASSVVILGLLGFVGSIGVSSYSSTSEMTTTDIAARRLVRLALDEAEEFLRAEALEVKGSQWYTALRQNRIDGSKFKSLETWAPLNRTEILAAEEGLEIQEISASIKLFQQNPFGVEARGRIWGGDQTFGTIAIEAKAILEAPRSGIFTQAREAKATRLVGFRATLPEPPAPFDQSPLWVLDPQFLRAQANAVQQTLYSVCPAIANQGLPGFDSFFQDMFYARIGSEKATAESLGFQLTASGCSDAGEQLKAYGEAFKADYRFVKDPATQKNMLELFWPQFDDRTYASRTQGRANRIFQTEEELWNHLNVKSGKPVVLSGIYHVAGPVTVDFRYEGRGAIVSPSTIQVIRAAKTEDNDTLTLVSTEQDVNVAAAYETVEAALVATQGSVTGLSGKHIRGQVLARRLTEGFQAGDGTVIEFDPALTRHQPGAMTANPDMLQVHIDPVPLAQS